MIDLTHYTDAQILACTAYGENRGGGLDGMQSVMNVIMNRASKGGWWGNTPREVCLKRYQFSCWMGDTADYDATVNAPARGDSAYTIAYSLAQTALSTGISDITSGACYYFAKSISTWPHWAVGHTPCADIEGQLFFNDIP